MWTRLQMGGFPFPSISARGHAASSQASLLLELDSEDTSRAAAIREDPLQIRQPGTGYRALGDIMSLR